MPPTALDMVASEARAFRTERLSIFDAGEFPATLVDGPKAILHVVPARAFEAGAHLEIPRLPQAARDLHPLSGETFEPLFNYEGFLLRESEVADETISYVQIFRNGILEFVDAALLTSNVENTIATEDLEHGLIRALRGALRCLQALGAAPPVIAYLTLLRVRGLRLDADETPGSGPLRRDEILAPEIVVGAFDEDPARALKPSLDVLWNAAGFPGSIHFDAQGRWSGLPL